MTAAKPYKGLYAEALSQKWLLRQTVNRIDQQSFLQEQQQGGNTNELKESTSFSNQLTVVLTGLKTTSKTNYKNGMLAV